MKVKSYTILFLSHLFILGGGIPSALAQSGGNQTVVPVSCDVYDAATGTKLNINPGAIADKKCKVGVATDLISSSSTKLLIHVNLSNGTYLPILEKNAVKDFLSGKTQAQTSVVANSAAALTFFQGLSGGGANCLSAAGNTKIPESCLTAIHFDELYQTVTSLKAKGNSSTTSKSFEILGNTIDKFFLQGGVGGMKDPISFLKGLNEGKTDFLEQGAALAGYNSSIFQTNFELFEKVGQIATVAFQDSKVESAFASDPSYQQQYFSFFESFETPAQANKVKGAGTQGIHSFFEDVNSFKSMNTTAAREMFIKEAELGYKNFANTTKMQTMFKTIAATDYSGKTLAAIKTGVEFVSGYVQTRAPSELKTVFDNPTIISGFIQNNIQTIDTTKLDNTFFDSFQTQIQETGATQPATFYNTFNYYSFIGGGTATLSDRLPAANEALVSVATRPSIKFSNPMNATTINSQTFTLSCGGLPIAPLTPGGITYDGTTWRATFIPASPLPKASTCTVTLTAGILSDISTPFSLISWNFTTERDDFSIASRSLCNQSNVSTNASASTTFSYPLDPATATATNFSVTGCGAPSVTISLSSDGKTITSTPATNYNTSSTCSVSVSTSIRDIFGRSLAAASQCTYQTGLGSDITPPTFAGCKTASSGSPTSLTVNWANAITFQHEATDDSTPRSGISFDVWCATTSGGQSFSSAPTASTSAGEWSTSSWISNLSANTTYYCVARAKDGTGNRESNVVQCSVTTSQFSAPYNLKATAGNGQVSLTWDSVSGASDYQIYRKTSSGVNAADTLVATTVTTSYVDSAKINGTKYFYTVRVSGSPNLATEAWAVPRASASKQLRGQNGAAAAVGNNIAVTVRVEDTSGSLLGTDNTTEVRLEVVSGPGSATFASSASTGTLLSGGGTSVVTGRVSGGVFGINVTSSTAGTYGIAFNHSSSQEYGSVQLVSDSYFYNFEDSDASSTCVASAIAGFTHSAASGLDDWQCGVCGSLGSGAPAGTQCWGTILGLNYYSSNSKGSLYTPVVTVNTAQAQPLGMTYYQYFTSESCCDRGYIEVSNDGGVTWKQVAPTAGYRAQGANAGWGGSLGGWEAVRVDLNGYDGNVQVRFRMDADSSYNDLGWYVDDTRLENGLVKVTFNAGPSTIWSETFEGDTSGWTLTGTATTVWHVATWCPQEGSKHLLFAEGESGTTCVENAGHDYDGGGGVTVTGNATSPSVSIPASGTTTVKWYQAADVESSSSYDKYYVDVLRASDSVVLGTLTKCFAGYSCSGTTYQEISWDITSIASGVTVKFKFRFDTTDSVSNSSSGWRIDNIRVIN